MIIKGKEGFYVIGSSRRVHLGGPYKKRVDAERQEIRLGIFKPKSNQK